MAETTSVLACYAHAWRQLRRHFWGLSLVWVVWLLANAIGWLLQIVLNVQQELVTIVPLALLTIAYSWLLTNPIGYGALYVYLRAARGRSPQVDDLFAPFRVAYLPSVLSAIMVGLLLVLSITPGVVVAYLLRSLSPPSNLIGSLIQAVAAVLIVFPAAFVAVRLAFVPFLVVDERLEAIAAIRESWLRVAGHGRTVLGLWLLAIPVLLLGLLLFLVGVLPATHMVLLAFASLFAAVTGRPNRA